MRSFTEQVPFERLLLEDTDVRGVLSAEEIARAFDLAVHLRHVDGIFARVFQPGPTA